MNIKQIIEIGCTKRNLSVTDLAAKLGTSKQNLFNKLYRNDIKTSDLEKLCNELDISIKFIDNQDGKEL